MLMTASDICAITKPWPVQKRVSISHTHTFTCMHAETPQPHMHLCTHTHTQKHTLIYAHTQISLSFPSPWQIAELVATEFFAQGDREKYELNIQPMVSL